MWLFFYIFWFFIYYTYADVPFFEDWGERNNYDKLGHFMQGFSPALIERNFD
jgi:putative membrane protein